jgi:hypothetical protein
MIDKSPVIEQWKKDHGQNKRVNAVWIDPDDKPEKRSFCSICARYMVWTKQGYYICESCGTKDEIKKESGKLQDEYGSEPLIGQSRKKKHDRSDFPEGAFIKEDTQINPDGEEKKLIVDNEGV